MAGGVLWPMISLCGYGSGRFNHHMIDMLVRLYDLPESASLYEEVAKKGRNYTDLCHVS